MVCAWAGVFTIARVYLGYLICPRMVLCIDAPSGALSMGIGVCGCIVTVAPSGAASAGIS